MLFDRPAQVDGITNGKVRIIARKPNHLVSIGIYEVMKDGSTVETLDILLTCDSNLNLYLALHFTNEVAYLLRYLLLFARHSVVAL